MKGDKCGCNTTASVSASQAGYEGSTPFTRSIPFVYLRIAKAIHVFVMLVFIAGCTTTRHATGQVPATMEIHDIRATGVYHTVRGGETLWQIARQYGLDIETLASANSLKDTSALEKGQVLVIPRPAARKIAAVNYGMRDSFIWPAQGAIISPFGTKIDSAKNKGIDINVEEGEEICASRAGMVVFCDDKLKGFGKTIILDHGDTYQTVYAYNSVLMVNVGDRVKQSDIIARSGKTGRAKVPSLHFEIRKNGEPRNPLHYLPRR